MEGMIVDDYKTDKNKGEVVAVRPIRYRQPKLEFYWVEGGMNRVTITLNISDTMSCSAEATFNVLEPNIMLMATAPGAVTDDVTRYRDIEGNLFRDRTKLPNGRFLHIGDGFAFDAEGNPIGTPGVLFNIQTFEPPADCDGELVWFQIVESSTRAFRKNNPSLSEVRTASGHDRSFPFSNTNSTKRIAIDSPGDVLASKRELTANGLNARSTIGVAINDSFTMYIGFKPKQHLCDGRISKSIIVPIKKVEWKWCGRATRNGGDPNNWTVSGTSEMGSVQDVGGMLPTWTKNVENATTTRKPNLGEFQECPDEPL
ncbi:MAG: hypothetical protein GC159_02730 [Phycisphaera sp.]|nr:hypothetical protein [Phycisphaera sp.]